MTYLIQIFLPLFDNDGAKLGRDVFHAVRDELTNQFGGLTGYTRAPIEGLWRDQGAAVQRDDLIIYEVMTSELDRVWWHSYRQTLEKQFRQDMIVIRAQTIEVL